MCAFCAKCLLLSEQNVLPRHGFLKWLYYLVVDTSMKNGPRERASERACRQPTEAACKLKYLNEPLLWTDFRVHYYNIFLTLDDGSNIWTRKNRAHTRIAAAHRSLSQPAAAATNQQWDTLFPRRNPFVRLAQAINTLYLFNLHSHYSDYLSRSQKCFFYLG